MTEVPEVSLDVYFSDAMHSWLNSLMITQLAPPERMSPYPHHPWPPTLVASGALLPEVEGGDSGIPNETEKGVSVTSKQLRRTEL